MPVDFERQTLKASLEAAGFNSSLPSFFTWLGVVPYLSDEAIWSTLRFISGLAGGAHVSFDYSNPPAARPKGAQAEHDELAALVAEQGEPWKTYFVTSELHGKLTAAGFVVVDDLSPRKMALRYFPARADSLGDIGGHVIHAKTTGVPPSGAA